jgi:hypothetical protein
LPPTDTTATKPTPHNQQPKTDSGEKHEKIQQTRLEAETPIFLLGTEY